MKPKEKNRLFCYILFPAAGALFLLWYIASAGADVVYSDYFRLIDAYLPDVGDPGKFMVPDVLTRIPAAFLQRFINVKFFSYSVVFDRICTIAGILLMAAAVLRFSFRHNVGYPSYAAVMIVLFSLSKWEVLLNGTCWAHMAAIGLFFVNFNVLDDIWRGESTGMSEFMALLMPFLWLLIAGEYIASYALTVMLFCIYAVLSDRISGRRNRNRKRIFTETGICTAVSLMLYILSRRSAVWEHSGASDMTLPELLSYAPSFLPKLLLKGFAGDICGQETLYRLALPDSAVYALGALVILAYVCAFIMFFKNGMEKQTVFPLLLLVSGGISHVLVAYARWIFLNENYLMSSRYAGQFMVGTVGMLLIFALYKKPSDTRKKKSTGIFRASAVLISGAAAVLILAGNIYTSYDEIRKAPYRRENYTEMAGVIRNYSEHTDEELCSLLEWHKDPEILKNAIEILEENELNVFSGYNDTGINEKGDKAA